MANIQVETHSNMVPVEDKGKQELIREVIKPLNARSQCLNWSPDAWLKPGRSELMFYGTSAAKGHWYQYTENKKAHQLAARLCKTRRYLTTVAPFGLIVLKSMSKIL